MGATRNTPPNWLSAAAASKKVEFDGIVDKSMVVKDEDEDSRIKTLADVKLSIGERAISAAAAAVVSALIVNPLDVAKVFLLFQSFFSL